MKKKFSIILIVFLSCWSSPRSLISMPSFADMLGDADMSEMFGGNGEGMPPFDFEAMQNDPEFQKMMEEMTKDPEFQKVLGEVEKMFEAQGIPTDLPPKISSPATAPRPAPATAAAPHSTEKQLGIQDDQTATQSNQQDLETEFIEGMPKEAQKGRKPTDDLPPRKEESLDYCVDNLVELLTEVENKLISSKKFSPTFRDVVGHFRKAIDAIKTELGIIQDQKIYSARLLSDEFAKLRTTMIKTTKELAQLNQKIVVTEKDESENSSDDLLQRRALENFDDDNNNDKNKKAPDTILQDEGDFDE